MAGVTTYNEDIAQQICEQIATTTHGLNYICKINDGFPNPSTVYKWLNEQQLFSERYARAREIQADLLADEIIRIAKTPRKAIRTATKEWGIEVTTGDAVDRSRLMVDAYKWKASKLAPKKYGDKVDVTSNGETVKQVFQINGVNIEF
jgi:hypothetical protein